MDAELENKIKEIGSAFGIEEMPDNLGDILSAFLGSGENSGEDNSETSDSDEKSEMQSMSDGLGGLFGNGMDVMRIIASVQAAQRQNENDYKIIFLKNLKPLLGTEKQNKVDKCVKLLYFAKIVEAYGQNG